VQQYTPAKGALCRGNRGIGVADYVMHSWVLTVVRSGRVNESCMQVKCRVLLSGVRMVLASALKRTNTYGFGKRSLVVCSYRWLRLLMFNTNRQPYCPRDTGSGWWVEAPCSKVQPDNNLVKSTQLHCSCTPCLQMYNGTQGV
jgi:hypothetical protein